MSEYISREAVNDLIEDIRNNHFILMSDRVTLALLKSKVAEIPVADVQPVKCGKWIWKERHRNSYRVVKGIDKYGKEGDLQLHEEYKVKVNYCSVCGKQGHEAFLNYCPNCGARMDGEQNE